jgi:hypothetical protein
MIAKRLVLLGVLASLWLAPAVSRGDMVEGYCCVCTACAGSPAASPQCISVEAPGSIEAHCANLCTGQHCQLLKVDEQTCDFNAAECVAPASAPAVSHPVLMGIAVLLAGSGVYLVRRRGTGHP